MKKYFLLVFFCALTTIGANAVVWPGDTGNDPIEGLRIYDDGNGTQYIEVTEPDALFNLYASYKDDDGLIGLGQDECKKLKLIGDFSDLDLTTLFVNESTGFWNNFTELDASEMNYVGDEEDGSELLFFPTWKQVKKITFPKSITVIPEGLYGDSNDGASFLLEEIIIPDLDTDNVVLGRQVFRGLTNLQKVTIGTGITKIENQTFGGCTSLTEVDMHYGIKEISKSAFFGCTSLKEVVLPEGLETIGEQAFMNTDIEAIRLPYSLKNILGAAFENCNSLKEIVIPEGVELIKGSATGENQVQGAFNGCHNLTDVYVLGNTRCESGAFNGFDINKFVFKDNNDGTIDRLDWEGDDGDSQHHPAILHVNEDIYEDALNRIIPWGVKWFEEGCPEPYTGDPFFEEFHTSTGELYMDYVFSSEWFVKAEDGNVYLKKEGPFFTNEPWRVLSSDYAGWQQFMLAGKVKTEKIWPDNRMVDDKWYSMCFPFPMSKIQLETAFGATVEVCEFSGVDIQEKGNKKLITLKFKRPVTETVAHRAYMIHPGFHNAESGTGTITNTIVGVQFANNFTKAIVEKNAAELTTDEQTVIGGLRTALTAQQTDITEGGVTYTFKGSYFKDEKLPKFTYYWWPGGDGWEASFYKTMTDGAVSWSPYTSVVLCDKDNHASNAKMVYYIETEDDLFEINEEQLGIATAITKPSTTKDSATVFEGKVMNLSGQVVADSTDGINGLPKGIYVVNGRKYVVR